MFSIKFQTSEADPEPKNPLSSLDNINPAELVYDAGIAVGKSSLVEFKPAELMYDASPAIGIKIKVKYISRNTKVYKSVFVLGEMFK